MIIPAEYFDILGFPMFIILLIAGIRLWKTEKKTAALVTTCAILGLLADGYILVTNFLF